MDPLNLQKFLRWLGKLPKRVAEYVCSQPMVSQLLQLRDAMETSQFVSVDLDQIMEQVSANQDEPTPSEIEDFKRRWDLDEDGMKNVDVNDYFKAHQKVSQVQHSLALRFEATLTSMLSGIDEPR